MTLPTGPSLLALRAWLAKEGYMAVHRDHTGLLTDWLRPKSSVLIWQSYLPPALEAPSGRDFWWAYESLRAGAQGLTSDLTEHSLVSSPSRLSQRRLFLFRTGIWKFNGLLLSFPPLLYFIFLAENLTCRGESNLGVREAENCKVRIVAAFPLFLFLRWGLEEWRFPHVQ